MARVEADEEGVTEDRLAGEDRDDLGDDPEPRQDQDVDLGMPEEPEVVLPQERVCRRRPGRKTTR